MNWEQVEGNWKKFRGEVKERWGRITDDDLDIIQGKRDQLAGEIQRKYGIAKEEAYQEIEDFLRKERVEAELKSY